MKQTYLHKYFLSMLLLLCGAGMLQAQVVRDTFRYSGQIVRWTVPAGVTAITIQARGAEGSGFTSPSAGLGASMQGTFSVVPGKVLKILVGQKPQLYPFPGGGGGSFVTDTLNSPLVIAGGGGGGGNGVADDANKHGQTGMAGGTRNFGSAGGTGGNGGNGVSGGGGGGGLLTNGGGGSYGGIAYIKGGAGGDPDPGSGVSSGFGGGGGGEFGGGGGGYSGGGGGFYRGGGAYTGGGGGGSINTGTNQINTGGVNQGNGLVTITYIPYCTPTITPSGSTTFCQGGSVTLTASGCDAYLWSNGATTQSITVNQSGTYSVKGINIAGISPASAAVTVTVNPLPAAPTITVTGPTTFCTGTRTVTTLTAPAGFASYLWSNGATNRFIVPTQSGSYTVRVTNSNGCTSPASDPVVITINPAPSLLPVFVAQPSCTNALGNVLINVENPASGITYSIDGTNYQTSNYFGNVGPGNYTATARNTNGCTASSNFTVNHPPPVPAAPTVSVTQPTCTTTGIITVTSPTGAAITYSINGTDYQTTNVFSNVAPGSYNVRIKNDGGCASAATSATVNQLPAGPAAPTVNVAQPTCTVSSGSITVNTPTGSGFTYSINGTDYQTTNSFSNIGPGNYNITVRNGSGCVSVATPATINAQPATPAAPMVSVTQPTCTVAAGTINVTNPTGTGFTYSINGTSFQSGNIFNNVPQGSYNVTVRNSTGCASSATAATINTQPASPAAPTLTVTQPTCTVATGTIRVNSPAGSGITYSIDNVNYQTSTLFGNVASGSYTLTVRNSSGCTSSATVTINTAPEALAPPIVSLTQPTCSVGTGTITVTAPTGADITYSFFGNIYQSSPTFDNVAPGSYSIRVRNSSGCTSPATPATINAQPASPDAPTVNVTQPTCSVATGTITVNPPTGTGITYSKNGTDYQIDNTFSNLAPGNYNLTTKNSAGCVSAVTPVAINAQPANPDKPVITASGPTTFCPGSSVTLTAPADFASYQWSNGAATQSITVNQSGSYSVVVRNNDGCSSPASDAITVTVSDNEKPVITCPVAQQFCNSSTGTYTIPALQATDNCGIQSTSYVVSGATQRSGTGNYATGSFNTGTSTITWTVKDASNNVSTCTTTVTVNSQILVIIPDSKTLNSNAVMTNTVYVGYAPASSITLTANATGGTGNYTYQWSNGKTTRSITVSPTATTTYTVTVKDGSTCTGTASKTINVTDVRCGNKLDKVSVCHNGNTLCLSDNAVSAHLDHPGDLLGDCDNGAIASRTATSSIDGIEETAATSLATIVYPNPNRGQFSVQLNSSKATKADVQIVNEQGVVINRKIVQTSAKSQTIPFNLGNPAAGTYLIKIVTKEGVQVLKMLVQP